MPAIEVKGTKSLMFCTPSIHKSGHRYQFLKQIVPGISDNLEGIIHDVLSKYDIEYLSRSDKGTRDRRRPMMRASSKQRFSTYPVAEGNEC